MTLDERLNVNQVPVRLGDLLARLDTLEQEVAEGLSDTPSPPSGQVTQPSDQSTIVRRLLALEDDVFSAASERSKLDIALG